jgi:hypothetical protein
VRKPRAAPARDGEHSGTHATQDVRPFPLDRASIEQVAKEPTKRSTKRAARGVIERGKGGMICAPVCAGMPSIFGGRSRVAAASKAWRRAAQRRVLQRDVIGLFAGEAGALGGDRCRTCNLQLFRLH